MLTLPLLSSRTTITDTVLEDLHAVLRASRRWIVKSVGRKRKRFYGEVLEKQETDVCKERRSRIVFLCIHFTRCFLPVTFEYLRFSRLSAVRWKHFTWEVTLPALKSGDLHCPTLHVEHLWWVVRAPISLGVSFSQFASNSKQRCGCAVKCLRSFLTIANHLLH